MSWDDPKTKRPKRIWWWWYDALSALIIAVAAGVVWLGRPSGSELDITGVLVGFVVLVFFLAMVTSAVRKFRRGGS